MQLYSYTVVLTHTVIPIGLSENNKMQQMYPPSVYATLSSATSDRIQDFLKLWYNVYVIREKRILKRIILKISNFTFQKHTTRTYRTVDANGK